MSEHEKKKDTYTITKVTLWQGISAVLAVLVVFMWFNGGAAETGGAANVPTPTQQAPSPSAPSPSAPAGEPARLDVSEDDDAVKGDPNAPITIIEFSDYECPFCARWYQQTLPQLEEEYVKTGKVKIVYRDFPLSFHANAAPAAAAAECAREQSDDDTYFEYHNALFDNYQSLGKDLYLKIGGDLGLDTGALESCIDAGTYDAEVQADFRDGGAAGVTGTPSFFINGVKLVGAQPYQAFKQVIDAELAE